MLGPSIDNALESGLLLENALSLFGVVPEIGLVSELV
jgi:hypothetical protein